jgi:hypothetical protein
MLGATAFSALRRTMQEVFQRSQFRIPNSEFRIPNSEFRINDTMSNAQMTAFRVFTAFGHLRIRN